MREQKKLNSVQSKIDELAKASGNTQLEKIDKLQLLKTDFLTAIGITASLIGIYDFLF